MSALDQQHEILSRLIETGAFPDGGASERIRRIETHISTVILAGDWAWKFKKPLDLGFLDFSTLQARRHYCEEELTINRRLAPEIYHEVASVNGDPEHPVINGPGEVLEYAVRMRRFDRERQLDRLLERGALPPEAMDALGRYIARFHEAVERSTPDSPHGTPEAAAAPMRDNFPSLFESARQSGERARLQRLQAWSEEQLDRLRPLMQARHDNGQVRHCHGDLHLGNMVYVAADGADHGEERPVAFDAIEFDPELRWIDVISEIAFTTMDLLARGAPAHAWRLLNVWLEEREDFEGLALLPLYQVYRALVRAKVQGIHAAEPSLPSDEKAAHQAEMGRYLALAERLTEARQPRLVLMHGVSGSGKTVISTRVLQALGAIRLRSDVERKRMNDQVSYSEDARARIYDHLLQRAGELLELGHTVIVDATFLERRQRDPFRELAARRGIGFAVVACHADEDLLRERLEARAAQGRDASDADVSVMQQQRPQQEWPGADEHAVEVGPGRPLDAERLARHLEYPAP
ncbi:bifunctional aminoglycoside phosphotransferase/ATP-binding protein [Thioalkalivibrio sp. ALJ24]|uniref:bifunctional aminoglycoside phosphotransferase/ATP-binding protein n=1 Tax=Thioalkalivibrio sp. ALJ24 TaxID=545276 RepID=UPI000372276F|nr:bifunctional aminoglycoside phosphotransferase/ATP-binding protein [Thioalkalivibrio sp. ALJ24]